MVKEYFQGVNTDMNFERKNYAQVWPYVWPVLWMLRMLCAGISMGLFTRWLDTKTSWGWWNIAISIAVIVAVYFITKWLTGWLAFLFKFLFSKLAGYRFEEFAYHWLYIHRKKGKLIVKKAKGYFKNGKLWMLPPKVEGERYSLLLFIFGGSIGLTLVAVFGLAFFALSPEKATAGMAVLLFASVLTLLGPVEFVLEQLLVEWDELLLEFQPWIKKARRMMLQISDSLSMGVWLQDIPEAYFVWEPEYVIVNYSTEWLACYRFQYLFYTKQYKEAEAFAESVLLPRMCTKKIRLAVTVRLLYIKMALCEDAEMIKQYYESEREILGFSYTSEDYRSLYLYFKFIAKQPEEAERYNALWEKALEGQEERDIAMEKEQVDFVEKKWGDTL